MQAAAIPLWLANRDSLRLIATESRNCWHATARGVGGGLGRFGDGLSQCPRIAVSGYAMTWEGHVGGQVDIPFLPEAREDVLDGTRFHFELVPRCPVDISGNASDPLSEQALY